jgi:hypothetical protein
MKSHHLGQSFMEAVHNFVLGLLEITVGILCKVYRSKLHTHFHPIWRLYLIQSKVYRPLLVLVVDLLYHLHSNVLTIEKHCLQG